MKFIDYRSLKETYTISEACDLFEMDKTVLKQSCEAHGIQPVRNEIGEGVFSKYDIRKLHNLLYFEERSNREAWDPWA